MASAAPACLEVETLTAKAGQLTEERLHHLLWLTRQQFPEVQVHVSAKPEIQAMLEALSKQRKINYQLIENPYSKELRLLSIEEPLVPERVGRGSKVASKRR